MREGLRIARWDVEAVERISRDTRALVYGACFMMLATLLTGVPLLFGTEPDAPRWPFAAIGILIWPPVSWRCQRSPRRSFTEPPDSCSARRAG